MTVCLVARLVIRLAVRLTIRLTARLAVRLAGSHFRMFVLRIWRVICICEMNPLNVDLRYGFFVFIDISLVFQSLREKSL